jgi:hypothetical protein
LFKYQQNEFNCGFISAIVYDLAQECRLVINMANISSRDTLKLQDKQITNPFIFWGKLKNPPHLITIHEKDIIAKLAYSKKDEVFHFFRYPNTVEST